jgi:hypothetical protein
MLMSMLLLLLLVVIVVAVVLCPDVVPAERPGSPQPKGVLSVIR